jgi:acyl transferase domain-containing protein
MRVSLRAQRRESVFGHGSVQAHVSLPGATRSGGPGAASVGGWRAFVVVIEHVERVRRLAAALADVVTHLGKLGDDLDALRLAARERR